MRRAVSARDAGLRRITAVTRWLVVGVVGLSGALALIASQAFHGRTVSNASASSAAVQAPAASSEGLSPANVAPTPTPAAPVVVSGGS
jgi:4-aminobutyrate aminotransferase-like enzyme